MENNDCINKQYLLIKSYRYWIKGPESEKANKLLIFAKNKGYCDETQEITGNKLKTWVKSERAPIWAYKAAVELLLETEYQPNEVDEIAALALVLSSLNKDKTALPHQLQQNEALCELLAS